MKKSNFIISLLISIILSAFVGNVFAEALGTNPMATSIVCFALANFIPKAQGAAFNNILPGSTNPNRKIVIVNDGFSPSNLKIGNQQATTRNVYDYIKIGTNADPQTIKFFQNVNQRTFPLTNLSNNQFAAGESIAVTRMHFSILLVATGTSGAQVRIDNVVTPDYRSELKKLWRSDLDFFIDNNRVIKQLSITSFKGNFNYSAKWGALGATYDTVIESEIVRESEQCVYQLEDSLVIPELISFRAELTIPAMPTAPLSNVDIYLGMHLEGFAGIVSPKTKF